MSYVRPVSMQETLNFMYKTLKNGAKKPLENFNGERTIEVYKFKDSMTKLTHKLEPRLWLNRVMVNIGSKKEPFMATSYISLDNYKGDGIDVFFKTPGDSTKGVTLNIERAIEDVFDEESYILSYKKDFKNLMEMRSDKYFKYLVDKIFGTHFIIDEKGRIPSDLKLGDNPIFYVEKNF